MKKVKITVFKTTLDKELDEEYGSVGLTACPMMKEGQIFYADYEKPEGFCDEAQKAIYQYVFALAHGSDNTKRDKFDICFNNWIKKDYWIKIIHNIEVDLINLSKEEQEFLNTFIAWIKEALQHTSVIVVEGNLYKSKQYFNNIINTDKLRYK